MVKTMKKEDFVKLGIDEELAKKCESASLEELKGFIPKARFDEVNTAKQTAEALVKERDTQRLQIMEKYCYTTECLRNYILKYFGENSEKPCKDCGNCLREFETLDMTDAAKKIINCVYEAKGRYGKGIIIDTVVGAKTAR
jgi:superfamily II DNA helicase RecQ